MNKRGQITIFVIVALVIAGGIIVYFFLRDSLSDTTNVSQELEPVFSFYRGCIEQETQAAIALAGSQGGYVEVPEYTPGSEYAPFASQLNFLGFPVPYWYYVSGNGVIKEEIPSKSIMEEQIARFIEEGLRVCDLRRFVQEGYETDVSDPEVSVKIEDEKVIVNVVSDISVSRGIVHERKTSHHIEKKTKLGSFFELAKRIYEKQKNDMLFEQYAVDVLRLYAPVDGVEQSCAPKVWNTQSVIHDIRNGLESNMQMIRFKGSYSDVSNKRESYFLINEEVDESINIMYSSRWPTKIEVYGEGVDDVVMSAEPVGTQEGMAAMGFCYVPYHFVYDVQFPVLVQIYNNDEIFQFPVVVIIDKNVPRQARFSVLEEGLEEPSNVCAFKTEEITVRLYDLELKNVEGNVSYECFNQRCRVGESRDGVVHGVVPACVNGYVHVRAPGYAEKKQLFSSNKEAIAEIVLEPEYDVNIIVNVDGKRVNQNTFVSFRRDDGKVTSAIMPEHNRVKLSEGNYEIRVYVYDNSSLVIPAKTDYKCVEVPRSGLLGLFGGTKEECFDIQVPETRIDMSLSGGGVSSQYLLSSELAKRKVKIDVDSLPKPTTLEQLQKNFALFESKEVNLNFYET